MSTLSQTNEVYVTFKFTPQKGVEKRITVVRIPIPPKLDSLSRDFKVDIPPCQINSGVELVGDPIQKTGGTSTLNDSTIYRNSDIIEIMTERKRPKREKDIKPDYKKVIKQLKYHENSIRNSKYRV